METFPLIHKLTDVVFTPHHPINQNKPFPSGKKSLNPKFSNSIKISLDIDLESLGPPINISTSQVSRSIIPAFNKSNIPSTTLTTNQTLTTFKLSSTKNAEETTELSLFQLSKFQLPVQTMLPPTQLVLVMGLPTGIMLVYSPPHIPLNPNQALGLKYVSKVAQLLSMFKWRIEK